MNGHDETADALGLQFCGAMTASISHELKNALAIVNENAGLLGDLAQLAERGRPLEPQRLGSLAEKIRHQVQRADTIIRRLNRFAHSASEPAVTTDLREMVEFTVALATRLATMKGVTLQVAPGEPIPLEVRPFVLENLLWLCLKHFFTITEGSQTVEFSAAQAGEGRVLTLRFGDTIPVAEIGARVVREGQALLTVLGAEVQVEPGLLRLHIPKTTAQSRSGEE